MMPIQKNSFPFKHNREAVRLGDHDLTTMNEGASTIEIPVAHTRVHEEYVPDIILNDIAIIKLKRQAPINGIEMSAIK